MYLLLKWIHILSAIVGVGANATYAIWMRAAEEEKAATPFAVRGIARLETYALYSYILLLLTGLAMLFVGSIPWTTPWVLVSLILYVLMAMLGGRGYSPALKRQTEFANQPDSSEYLAAKERATHIGVLILLIAILIEYLMTVKPVLWT
ncbi:MAG: DUF2269 family protein [Chloroflexi bacterium]|nr:DUF2269 family protein [Chloroflexota bacterium]